MVLFCTVLFCYIHACLSPSLGMHCSFYSSVPSNIFSAFVVRNWEMERVDFFSSHLEKEKQLRVQ